MSIRRIAYIGNFRAPWCTEVHLTATLERLGHDVDRIQEDEVPWPDIVARCFASDLVMYQRTPPGLASRTGIGAANVIRLWDDLKHVGIPTASYHLDLYFGIKRQKDVSADPFWRTQFVFTPDGDPAAQAWFEQQRINHHYIRPGIYKPEAVPGRANPDRFPHQVVFVGSWVGYHKEWQHRRFLVEHLRDRWGAGLYGHDGLGTVRGFPLNDLYATATVVVGDSLCPGYTKPNYWSDRAYETIGRGGCLLHPLVPGMEDEFTGGEHLLYYDFGNFEQLDGMIEHLLANPDLARDIALAGQRYVHANCTYDDRLTQALAIIEAGL